MHLKVVLEIINSAFYTSLNEELMQVIEYSLNIHKIILGIADNTIQNITISYTDPKPQWIYQRTLMSISSLFEDITLILSNKRYYEICKDTIEIYNNATSMLGKYLEMDTWHVLMRVLIGIADYLIVYGNTKNINDLIMASIECVVITFFKSGRNYEETFEEYFVNWAGNKLVLNYWYDICLGFTYKMIDIFKHSIENTVSHMQKFAQP